MRPRARLVLGLAAVAGVGTTSGAAHASPTSRLVYVRGTGAESCPDEPEMRRAVATRLGYDPFRPLASTTITAEVRRERGVFRGRVRLVDDAGVERGARDLESRADDCRDLTTAMALSMSIAIDPLSMMRAQPPEPAPAQAEDPVAVSAAPAAPAAPSPPSPSSSPSPPASDLPAPPAPVSPRVADPPRLALGAGGHVALGIAPAPALGLHVGADLRTRRWSLGVEGRFDLAASSGSSEGGRSSTSLAGASVVPCVRVPLVWACGLVLLSRVEAEALEVSAPRTDAFFFLGAGGRLATAIALPEQLVLQIGGDVLAHPAPFELTLNGRRVHRSSTVSALAGLTVARIF